MYQAPHKHIVTEKVVIPKDPAYYKLMRLVFRGTAIPDLARYPKRSGRNGF